MLNRPADDAGLDTRLHTMRILWGAQLMTVGLFVLITRVTRPDPGRLDAVLPDNPTLLYGLAAAGLTAVASSFALKSIFFRRAAEQQQPGQAQTGLVLALALCETAALLGLVAMFVTWDDRAYLLFALGALGMLLHFPRREQLLVAFYGPGGSGRAGQRGEGF